MDDARTVYLTDVPFEAAWERFVSALSRAGVWSALPGESVPLTQARGRITAEPVWARISAPHYHAAAMDGYAVRAVDTHGATEIHPVRLHVLSGDGEPLPDQRPALAVNTGHPLPAWADAVIMIEHVQPVGEELAIHSAVVPWQHVRPMGEDMVATELVLPANHILRPVDLGALTACGHQQVSVRRPPRVAVIPTGSELVSVETLPMPGQIIESNSLILAAQIEQWGGLPTRWEIVPDEPARILDAVKQAVRSHDLVLINAGSSAGTKDHTAHVVRSLGELLAHGVAVRPGHPVVLGLLADGERPVPVIGVPGYPVSAALTGEIFVEPVLARWLGRPPARANTMPATISRKVLSPGGDEEYLRVTVGQVGDQVIATPLSRGAGVITSLVRADGIVHIPRFSEGFDANDPVTVALYRHPDEIAQTIVCIGSHDLTLDLLAQYVAERAPGLRLSSANVGSLGGLLALQRGQAHLAGSHLLEPQTGEYNFSYVRQYLPGQHVFLVTLVGREQGVIVPKGNPQHITGIPDLVHPEVRFVNRQRGAGTRLLLDYLLGQHGLRPDQVSGYERQEFTHLAVAAAVASGAADCGLGVRAAAHALDLDFVPLAHERYDLVIPAVYYTSDLLQPLLALLHDPTFRAAVAALPGYDVSHMGQIAAEIKPESQS